MMNRANPKVGCANSGDELLTCAQCGQPAVLTLTSLIMHVKISAQIV